MKANPATEITELLRDKGSNFDIASIYELTGDEDWRRSGAHQLRQHHQEIQATSATLREGRAPVRHRLQPTCATSPRLLPAPRSTCVFLTEGSTTADWPLSRKFGCQTDMAMDLLILARQLGLEPYGISFHVGPQQRDISVWDAAIAKVKVIFERLKEEDGIVLKMINMGGGFPANCHHQDQRLKPMRRRSSASSRRTSATTCRKSSRAGPFALIATPASWSAKWCWSPASRGPPWSAGSMPTSASSPD